MVGVVSGQRMHAGFVGLEDQLSGPCSVVAWEEGWERREKNPMSALFPGSAFV